LIAKRDKSEIKNKAEKIYAKYAPYAKG